MLAKMGPAFVLAMLLLNCCFTQNDGMELADSYKSFLKDQGNNMGGLYGEQKKNETGLAKYQRELRRDLKLAKTIGDAVVPIISMGLKFIPVVGPLISGTFGILWKLFDPLFADPDKKDPIEELQRQMTDYIKKSIDATEKRMNATMQTKFRELIHKSIYSKSRRDRYICDKYSTASRVFSRQVKEKQAVSLHRRASLAGYLDNCDNFLKDTVEGFDFSEYADTLWIPALQSTMTRLSLISEAIYWGKELDIIPEIIVNFHGETTLDVKRQLNRFRDATALIREFVKKNGKRYDFSPEEVDACRMQAMLPYFDTSVYPKGMPIRTYDPKAFSKQEDTIDVYHAQYFYRNLNYKPQDSIMNCFMGSLVTTTADGISMTYFMEKVFVGVVSDINVESLGLLKADGTGSAEYSDRGTGSTE
ncbi:hypothetical protein Bhyg_04268 [Pseudolycoriella hygida]|uniref:Uncharacterized protein n=1 Tax=Pseudolycoriella hygida TaxID=35572 RepID=A0A9Q0NGD7_9DIPT|nr:hypothetical protein Bhyg_04268 [Pseudolycoriella hygida]